MPRDLELQFFRAAGLFLHWRLAQLAGGDAHSLSLQLVGEMDAAAEMALVVAEAGRP